MVPLPKLRLGRTNENGGWCCHQPPIPESFPSAGPGGPASCPPSGGFGHTRPAEAFPAAPARAAVPAGPAGSPFGRPRRRHRPEARTPERPSCRAGIGVSPSPSAAARSSRPALASPAGFRGKPPGSARIGRTFDTAVSVRVSPVPPGFCRGCRARLAVACTWLPLSRRLRQPPSPCTFAAQRRFPLRPCPGTAPSVSGPARPWPHREAVTFPESGEEQCACGLRG